MRGIARSLVVGSLARSPDNKRAELGAPEEAREGSSGGGGLGGYIIFEDGGGVGRV